MSNTLLCTPAEADARAALLNWPALAGRRVRTHLVSAFGDIYFEDASGTISVVDTWELRIRQVAPSPDAFQAMLADSRWRDDALVVQLVALASERGKSRSPEQVFAVSPHPCFSGKVLVDHLMRMDLPVWHSICAQLSPV